MKKRLGGVAIAVAAVIGFASSPAAAAPAGPIVITPGYKGVITTNEPSTFLFTGCDGTIEFVLAVFDENLNEIFTFLGSVPGPGGSYTFSSPTPGTFKIIVNCFVDDVRDSTDFVFFEVVPPPVDTTIPTPTTAAPVPTTADPGPAPTTAAPVVPGPTTTPVPGATTTSVVGALSAGTTPGTTPGTTRGASVSQAGALPATGQDNTALLAAAGALLVVGTTLVLVRRRPA